MAVLRIFGLLLALVGAALAKEPSVKIEGPTGAIQVPGTAKVRIKIAEGFHVYGKNDAEYIPLDVKAKDGAARVTDVRLPAAKPMKFAGEEKPIPVYEGTVEAEVSLEPAAGAAVGDGKATLTVSWQACTEEFCEDPAKGDVLLAVRLTKAGGAAERVAERPGTGTGTKTEMKAGAADSRLWQLFGVFVAGLLVTLTPCVYPVIPVTISYFQQQAGTRGKAIVLALVYGGGIIVMYAALGVAMSLLGRDLGSLLGNPYVGWGFVIFFAALALSMFGFYDLQLPSSWQTKLQSGERGGIAGALFLGLTLSLVAAPCVGPAAGVLMGIVAQTRDLVYGTVAFASFGLGLALPFMVLGVFSGALSAMPRAGEWMDTVKHIFGYILLAFSIYYVFVTTGSQALVFALTGAWLLAASQGAKTSENVLARAFAVAALAGGLYFTFGPYILAENGAVVPPQKLFESKIKWLKDHDAGLAEAKRAGKPAIVDFTATWCNACHELDLTTFRDERVVSEISRRFVPVKVDVTRDEGNQKIKTEVYKAYAIPYIAFYDSNGKLVASLPREGSSGIHTEDVLALLKETR